MSPAELKPLSAITTRVAKAAAMTAPKTSGMLMSGHGRCPWPLSILHVRICGARAASPRSDSQAFVRRRAFLVVPAVLSRDQQSFFNAVRILKLDPARIVPVHGKPIPWSDFVKIANSKTN